MDPASSNGTTTSYFNEPSGTHDSRAEALLVAGIVSSIIVAITAALRIYVRGFMVRRWGADDTFLVCAAVAVLLHNSFLCVEKRETQYMETDSVEATKFGLGSHWWVTPISLLLKGRRIALFVLVIYQIAYVTIKIAFLLQYRRVFPGRRVELCCNVGITFLVIFGLSLLVAQGMTYEYVYKQGIDASPVDVIGWWIANAAIHLITSILIFILPLPLLGRLRLNTTQKAALFASFGLGLLTCAASVVRLVKTPDSLKTIDIPYEAAVALVWAMIELSCAVVCCCIPTLRPLTRPSRYAAGGSRSRVFADDDAGTATNTTVTSTSTIMGGPLDGSPGAPRGNDRVSSSLSCESDVAVRKTASSSVFFWQRGRQKSDQGTLGGGRGGVDDIEPAMPVAMMTVTAFAALADPVVRPQQQQRRPSLVTMTSSNGGDVAPRRTRSIRSSIRSEGSLVGIGGLRRDLSFRRRMSAALTERDSDDDIYYFGANEEEVDMECPTPLSPPPKTRQSVS
ncbi:integral membrane protein [Colletotrichum plurivorum]|uniref:Integral membrane protein n=1 Tax=Colletotrichum plurivorum TaxID=2175906 RepID=A0A8H6JQ25_9PEZI|nr:integral membrane protein [Colletotrichum plurivorum]